MVSCVGCVCDMDVCVRLCVVGVCVSLIGNGMLGCCYLCVYK